MYDLGDVVGLQVTILDASNNPADATTVVATILKPDGTTVQPTVNHPGVGIYTLTYTPTDPGRYEVDWNATGTNASSFTDVFDVRSGASTQLFSLADAKNMLNITSTNLDEEIRDYIFAVTDVIEGKIGAVIPRTVVEQVQSYGSALAVSVTPVISVTSLTPVLVGGYPFTTVGLVVDSLSGIIRRADRGTFLGDVYLATYQAGRPGPIPAAISMAARIILKHLWQVQRGTGRAATDPGADSPGYLIPNRAETLLEPYKLPSVIV